MARGPGARALARATPYRIGRERSERTSALRARKVDPLVSPRQSRDKCKCGRVLQNQHHERVTGRQAALKTTSSVLTTRSACSCRARKTPTGASTSPATLHQRTTWTLPTELHRSPAANLRNLLASEGSRSVPRHLLGITCIIRAPVTGWSREEWPVGESIGTSRRQRRSREARVARSPSRITSPVLRFTSILIPERAGVGCQGSA